MQSNLRPAEDRVASLRVDPTYRLSRLKAANSPPVSVAADRPVVEAVTLMARLEGILLDPVYTGKAMKGRIS